MTVDLPHPGVPTTTSVIVRGWSSCCMVTREKSNAVGNGDRRTLLGSPVLVVTRRDEGGNTPREPLRDLAVGGGTALRDIDWSEADDCIRGTAGDSGRLAVDVVTLLMLDVVLSVGVLAGRGSSPPEMKDLPLSCVLREMRFVRLCRNSDRSWSESLAVVSAMDDTLLPRTRPVGKRRSVRGLANDGPVRVFFGDSRGVDVEETGLRG